ncbi:hypothetical protein SNEBB_004505 [Seison nebaliae]|nr:hypothetical protein SNEBB_004505 [Seison nebaliae]
MQCSLKNWIREFDKFNPEIPTEYIIRNTTASTNELERLTDKCTYNFILRVLYVCSNDSREFLMNHLLRIRFNSTQQYSSKFHCDNLLHTVPEVIVLEIILFLFVCLLGLIFNCLLIHMILSKKIIILCSISGFFKKVKNIFNRKATQEILPVRRQRASTLAVVQMNNDLKNEMIPSINIRHTYSFNTDMFMLLLSIVNIFCVIILTTENVFNVLMEIYYRNRPTYDSHSKDYLHSLTSRTHPRTANTSLFSNETYCTLWNESPKNHANFEQVYLMLVHFDCMLREIEPFFVTMTINIMCFTTIERLIIFEFSNFYRKKIMRNIFLFLAILISIIYSTIISVYYSVVLNTSVTAEADIKTKFFQVRYQCTESLDHRLSTGIIYLISIYGAPAIVLTLVYSRIGYKLCQVNNTTIKRELMKRKRVLFILLLMIGAFYFCWSPYMIMQLFVHYSCSNIFHNIRIVLIPCCCSVFWINPLIYLYSSQIGRMYLREKFFCNLPPDDNGTTNNQNRHNKSVNELKRNRKKFNLNLLLNNSNVVEPTTQILPIVHRKSVTSLKYKERNKSNNNDSVTSNNPTSNDVYIGNKDKEEKFHEKNLVTTYTRADLDMFRNNRISMPIYHKPLDYQGVCKQTLECPIVKEEVDLVRYRCLSSRSCENLKYENKF